MREILETGTTIVVAIELLVAVWLAWRLWHESRFLERVEPLIPKDENLPLFDALLFSSRYTTAAVTYLLLLTALGVAGITVAEYFPPIRAISGAVLIGLLYRPLSTGRALRRRVEGRAAEGQ